MISLTSESLDMDSQSSEVPVFQFQNSNLNNRCRDVFATLDDLEQKHKDFERNRSLEDAELDLNLINQGPSIEDSEPVNPEFKHPMSFSGRGYSIAMKGGKHGHKNDLHSQEFRKPMRPPPDNRHERGSRKGFCTRGGRTPDYTIHPDRWTEYSLADVDVGDAANKRAAFEFLDERRKLKESFPREDVDVDAKACSKGLFMFKKPSKGKGCGDFKSDTNVKQTENRDADGDNKAKACIELVLSGKSMLEEGDEPLGSDNMQDISKMEEDDESRNEAEEKAEEMEENQNVDKETINEIITSGSFNTVKRKLSDLTKETALEISSLTSEEPGFKNRKISKKNFRTRRDSSDDDNEEADDNVEDEVKKKKCESSDDERDAFGEEDESVGGLVE